MQDVGECRKTGKFPWAYIVPALVILVVIVGVVYFEFANHAATGYQSPPGWKSKFSIFVPFRISFPSRSPPDQNNDKRKKNVTIPSGIGIKNPVQEATYKKEPYYGGGSNSCFEPVHTHDDSEIIHIESPTDTNYTLGNFFRIWSATYAYAIFNGLERTIIFNSTDILGYKVNGSSTNI